MMLSVLEPWEPAWSLDCDSKFLPGPSRRRCDCVSSIFPLRQSRFIKQTPRSRWRIARPKQHTLSELLDQFRPSSDWRQAVNRIREDLKGFETFDRPKESPREAILETGGVFAQGLFKPLEWQEDDSKQEARAEIQLPRGLRKPDDITLEVDEASRMLTLTATHCGGPDNQTVSKWSCTQRLSDSIDLDKLQAAVDTCKNALQLRAPLQVIHSVNEALVQPLPIQIQRLGKREEIDDEDQPPSKTETSSKDESHTKGATVVETNGTALTGTNANDVIEIEDVGPDEESDRVSTSSN